MIIWCVLHFSLSPSGPPLHPSEVAADWQQLGTTWTSTRTLWISQVCFLVCKQSEAGYYMIMKFSNISKISPWLFSPRLGLLVALQYVLRMAPGSLLYSGLPCSLHVWIARGTSLKTRCNPRGNLLKSCVREANLIACRFSMVVLVCLVRQIWHLTEQPGSSVARHLPYLELALHPDRMMMGFQSSLCQYLYHVFIQDVCDFTVPSAPKCHFGGKEICFCMWKLSWMGLFGHRSLKRSMAFGTSWLSWTAWQGLE